MWFRNPHSRCGVSVRTHFIVALATCHAHQKCIFDIHEKKPLNIFHILFFRTRAKCIRRKVHIPINRLVKSQIENKKPKMQRQINFMKIPHKTEGLGKTKNDLFINRKRADMSLLIVVAREHEPERVRQTNTLLLLIP